MKKFFLNTFLDGKDVENVRRRVGATGKKWGHLESPPLLTAFHGLKEENSCWKPLYFPTSRYSDELLLLSNIFNKLYG